MTRSESELSPLFRRWKMNLWCYLSKIRQNWKMRTPPPGGKLIWILESNLPLLKWNNVDRSLKIVEKRKRLKRKQQRRQPKQRFIYYSSDLKLLIGASNPWTVCLCLTPTKKGQYNVFNNNPTPSRMSLYTLEENYPKWLIKEGIQ